MSTFFNAGDVFTAVNANRLFNGVGRDKEYKDLRMATLSNITESSNSYSITTGQTGGTITRLILDDNIISWGHCKFNVSGLGTANQLTYTIKNIGASETTIVASTEITDNQDDFIVDLASIDRATYPDTLEIEFTFSRDSTGDTSPTLSDFSLTAKTRSTSIEKIDDQTSTVQGVGLSVSFPGGYDAYFIRLAFESTQFASGMSLVLNIDTGSNYQYHWETFALRSNQTLSSTYYATSDTTAQGEIKSNTDTYAEFLIMDRPMGLGFSTIEAKVWNEYPTRSAGQYNVDSALTDGVFGLLTQGTTPEFKVGAKLEMYGINF